MSTEHQSVVLYPADISKRSTHLIGAWITDTFSRHATLTMLEELRRNLEERFPTSSPEVCRGSTGRIVIKAHVFACQSGTLRTSAQILSRVIERICKIPSMVQESDRDDIERLLQ